LQLFIDNEGSYHHDFNRNASGKLSGHGRHHLYRYQHNHGGNYAADSSVALATDEKKADRAPSVVHGLPRRDSAGRIDLCSGLRWKFQDIHDQHNNNDNTDDQFGRRYAGREVEPRLASERQNTGWRVHRGCVTPCFLPPIKSGYQSGQMQDRGLSFQTRTKQS
jgi:hypothetical protein